MRSVFDGIKFAYHAAAFNRFQGRRDALLTKLRESAARSGFSVELTTANGVPAVSQGDVVTVCIRPEDVVTRNITAKTPNAIQAIVDELEFLGSFYRATLRPQGPDQTRFRADFSINLMRDLHIAEGGEVTVALPPEHLRIYKDTFITTGDVI